MSGAFWGHALVRRLAITAATTLAASSLAFLQVQPAAAAISLTVTTTADVHGTCSAGACPTLRAAVEYANNLSGLNSVSVTVPAGTYDLTLGELQITNPGLTMSLDGAGPGLTVVEHASTSAPDRVFDTCTPNPASPPPCLSPGATVNLAELTVRHGALVNLTDPINVNGAGIRNFSGAMSLTDVAVLDNSISVGGTAADASPHGGVGGGIANFGALSLTRTTVSGNSITMTNYTLAGGAGILSRGPITIDNSTISNNAVTGCTDANLCGLPGVGVVQRFNNLTITNSTISGNHGDGPAGISSAAPGFGQSPFTTTITNSTISGNSATGSFGAGGGIETFAAGMNFLLTNDTIANNSATAGFGAGIDGPFFKFTLKGTIVAGNNDVDPATGATSEQNCSPSGPFLPPPAPPPPGVNSLGYNLDSGNTCRLQGPGDLVNTDPKLGPLQDNGGPTVTQALAIGSPAIDAVANDACPPPAADQRGVPRPQGPRCDIGAFEFAEPSIAGAGTTISATEGTAFSGVVATFSDPDSSATAGEYAATIDWGDGSGQSAGTIAGSNGRFAVSGSHTYTEEGSQTVTVTITDTDTPTNTATAHSPANIADAALTATGRTITSTNPVSGTVASFTDADGTNTAADSNQAPSDYTATVSWGDGTASAGTVTANGSGFNVNGSHTYGPLGPYTLTVDVQDVGGSKATATSAVLVFAFSSTGSFVAGNVNAAVGASVTWWGAQWGSLNLLSGGIAPASFKGFANTSTPPVCGGSWSTTTGDSSAPPADVPSYMAVVVSGSISQSGSVISGKTAEIVIVKTDPGYAPAVGHAGTGTVVSVLCHT